MKRLLALILLSFTLVFSSCGAEKYNILPFEGKNSTIACTVNDRFDVRIEKKGGQLSLSVTSPEEISGVSFLFSEEGDRMISGDMTIPVDRRELFGIYSIASVPELSEEAMTSAVSKNGTGEISIEKDGLLYTVLFSADGEITDIDIRGNGLDYSLRIKSVSVSD